MNLLGSVDSTSRKDRIFIILDLIDSRIVNINGRIIHSYSLFKINATHPGFEGGIQVGRYIRVIFIE